LQRNSSALFHLPGAKPLLGWLQWPEEERGVRALHFCGRAGSAASGDYAGERGAGQHAATSNVWWQECGGYFSEEAGAGLVSVFDSDFFDSDLVSDLLSALDSVLLSDFDSELPLEPAGNLPPLP
jgi:hypothetical protein